MCLCRLMLTLWGIMNLPLKTYGEVSIDFIGRHHWKTCVISFIAHLGTESKMFGHMLFFLAASNICVATLVESSLGWSHVSDSSILSHHGTNVHFDRWMDGQMYR